ncbi:nmrA-like family domain-containing protein 1 isoform X2 [Protopterus annectens]|uniref:nmrA-like family domain-containing protein 1 isoform X2 n=1 Tax=Protopterus annectens TaxID=7888 RepID=UPI001CFB12B0|nr:nmrA-like family domain-containing protein 1 isoform X2 [Protopterus annectens]
MCDKLVVVFGATGAQGGSVAKALLEDGTFKVRIVSRDLSKPACKDLEKLGAEVVKADLDDVELLRAALHGAHAVFLVTNYWEYHDKDKEGKRFADVAKQAGLQHVVFSGLENVYKLTNGKLEVEHFDGKGEIEEYFRQIGVPLTSVRLPFYFENFKSVFKPKKLPDGSGYALGLPMGNVPMHGMAVVDLGPVVVNVLKSPEKYIGKDIGLTAGSWTCDEYAKIISKYTGKNVVDGKMSADAYEKLGFPGAVDLANMFRAYTMNILVRDTKLTSQLNANVRNFEEWVQHNKHVFDDL